MRYSALVALTIQDIVTKKGRWYHGKLTQLALTMQGSGKCLRILKLSTLHNVYVWRHYIMDILDTCDEKLLFMMVGSSYTSWVGIIDIVSV